MKFLLIFFLMSCGTETVVIRKDIMAPSPLGVICVKEEKLVCEGGIEINDSSNIEKGTVCEIVYRDERYKLACTDGAAYEIVMGD